MTTKISNEEIENLYSSLQESNIKRGYFLNPDSEFTKSLVESLLVNEKRYGYQACPCRLATGTKADDLDIVCPCDYRDADVTQFGACYCGLYVSKKVCDNKEDIHSIPERRPSKSLRNKLKNMPEENSQDNLKKLSYPVWRCEVCGYICARPEAPDTCPICGVSKDRFQRFM
jgi:ferredoxin-thioredoxin reductase catalytic subunit